MDSDTSSHSHFQSKSVVIDLPSTTESSITGAPLQQSPEEVRESTINVSNEKIFEEEDTIGTANEVGHFSIHAFWNF